MSRHLPKIWLADRTPEMIREWTKHCGSLPGVTIKPCQDIGRLLDQCPVIVSPANSFGVMDGGIDITYSVHFGWHVQDRLRAIITEQHYGELPVGAYAVVPINETQKLIAAPTMRVPQNVCRTTNAYSAMRAILIACIEHNLDGPVLIPGMCTGVGRMPCEIAARQMAMAYRSIYDNPPIMNLRAAARHELALRDPDFES